MNSYETMENREQTLMRLINDSRLELQLSSLPPKELEATMKTWIRRLYSIPDERLQRCFDYALERHNKRSALIPAQIIEAWMQVRLDIENAARYQTEREDCEFNCSVDGWITVNANGSIWMGQESITYAKCCPIHRPQGWRNGEMTDKNYRKLPQN